MIYLTPTEVNKEANFILDLIKNADLKYYV